MHRLLRLRLAFAVLAMALSAGCARQDLYTDLPEKEANEMMAILIDNGIDCNKDPGSDDLWTLSVPTNDFSRSVTILSELGRPRKSFVTIDKLFPQTGFVSSPTEQHIRLNYGLEQSLEETISSLPKIVNARVHLDRPEQTRSRSPEKKPSASVVVWHQPNSQTEDLVPKVKQIIVGAMSDIDEENVFVEDIEAEEDFAKLPVTSKGASLAGPKTRNILSIQVVESSVPKFLAAIAIAGFVILIGVILAISSLFRMKKPS